MRILIFQVRTTTPTPPTLHSPPPTSLCISDDHRLDLREQHEVRLDEGLDTFVVVDGCPIVSEDQKQKLIKFLCKKLGEVGKTKPDAVFMPVDEKTKMTEG